MAAQTEQADETVAQRTPGTALPVTAEVALVPIVTPGATPDVASMTAADLFGALGSPTLRLPRDSSSPRAHVPPQALSLAPAAVLDPEAKSPASAKPATDAPADVKPKRRSPRKKAEPPVGDAGETQQGPAVRTAPKRAPRTTGGPRKRTTGVLGLAERARQEPDWQTLLSLPDALFSALPPLRQAVLNHPLDEALRLVAEGLALALAPAAARIWIAELSAWSGGASRVGGSGLLPALRLRARARALGTGLLADVSAPDRDPSDGEDAAAADPLLAEVAATRSATILFDAVGHPLALRWTTRPEAALPALGTLAAYPLRARGQFLGVLAVGAAGRLSGRQLTALEELADLIALAADRDRLLSYSRGQEALAQTAVQHAPVAMAFVTGPEYVLALANPAFAALLGVESDTPLAGMKLAAVVGERARVLATTLRLDAAYAGDEPQAMVELPIHRDARVTYWNVTTSPVIGLARGGALVAAVEVTRQVSARRRAQESAEVAEERLRQMMSLHAASLAVASQLDADPRELLADLLRRSIALLGARAGCIYVRDPRDEALEIVVTQGLRRDYTGRRVHGDEDLAGLVARTRRGSIVGDSGALALRPTLVAGETICAAIAVPLIHHNQIVGVLEVLDDGSRRAFTEADLWLLELFAAQAAQAIQNARMYIELERAYRKQRDLDRLKDDFIATASHELRTPLTGVQGFLELLVDLPAAQADPMVTNFARKAYGAAEELAEIAERLLQTSRLDTGRMELHLEPVALAHLVEEALRAKRDLPRRGNAVYELEAAIPDGVTVVADRARLKEVLDNLIGNALKYSPRGGRVLVAVTPFGDAGESQHERAIDERPTLVLPPIAVDDPDTGGEGATHPLPAVLAAAQSQPFVRLTVRDEGMGIPAGERGRLFGRFARLDGARSSQIRGTGLGLYICRQLARAMGGDVWLLESTPGEGSVFAVALPALPPHDGAPAHGEPYDPSLR
jgi:signal transduction histidine kinase/PAS domain-containing protein